MIVVSISSPLISLAKIGAFDLLRKLYGKLAISAEVYAEVVVAGAGLPGAEDVSHCPGLRCAKFAIPRQSGSFTHAALISASARSAPCSSRGRSAPTSFCSTTLARKLAQRQGFKVQGSVAVLEACYRRGHVEDLRQAYERLIHAGVYLDRDLLNGILASLKLSPL